jgi:hypothetical protein
VTDESLGGLGVYVANATGFAEREVLVVCDGELRRQAKVVYVAHEDGGGARVGLAWVLSDGYV